VNLVMMSNVTKHLRKVWSRTALLVVCAIVLTACATSGRDGLDVAQLPEAVRPDYQLFARRCSKCHSLARPLGSGITDDEVWIAYVNRMRRQPGSGISPQDAQPILRFLHYYSSEQRRVKREHEEATGGTATPSYSSNARDTGSETANR
jgi:predicted small secreted protein